MVYCSYKRQEGKYSACCGENFPEAMVNARAAYAIRQMLKLISCMGGKPGRSITVEMPDVEKARRDLWPLREEQARQYEAYADGIISREEYLKKNQALSERIAKTEAAIHTAESLMAEEKKYSEDVQAITEQGEEFAGCGRLTKEVADALIKQVYVYDKDRVEVVFQYEDIIEKALKAAQEWYRAGGEVDVNQSQSDG